MDREHLLENYFAGTLTDAEKETLFQEIDDDPAVKQEFVRLQNIVALSGMAEREEDEFWISLKMREFQKTITHRQARRLTLSVLKYGVAAVLLICVWFASREYSFWEMEGKDMVETESQHFIEVPTGQRVHIILADGTEAWLNSRSKMTIPETFNRNDRIVELDGEGYFSVSKDKSKPFIVKTKQYNIEVLGTQFNVFAYSESNLFETDLLKGAVSLYKEENREERIPLHPAEKVFLENGVLNKAASDYNRSFFLKDGIYTFNGWSLQDICNRLELWYDVKITITRPKIADLVFVAKFRQGDDIDKVIKAIRDTGKFKYRSTVMGEIEIF